MSKILILPDIHWRDFYKEAIKRADEFEHIIFLGDYLDGYPYEGFDNDEGFNNLMSEILPFKEANMDKVTLLLGNHDLGYLNRNICTARHDWENAGRNREAFKDNYELFNIAWETEINGKRYFLSHAGVKKGWMEFNKRVIFSLDDFTKLPSADYFNSLFHSEDQTQKDKFFSALGDVSRYRGGMEAWGSMVWSDVGECFERNNAPREEFEGVFQIFGHTQLESKPILTDYFACLDVRRPFILDENGQITEFDGTPVEKTKIRLKTEGEMEEEKKRLERMMAFFI